MEYVKGEKFKDRMEAAEWCMDNKPIYRNGDLKIVTTEYKLGLVTCNWHHWHKAIEKPEPIEIGGWVNLKDILDHKSHLVLYETMGVYASTKAKLIIYPEGE